MLIAPRSCSTSSAAIVSRRMRLSANARSSAMLASRWWHTISMSRCSSTVLTVYGIVGLVDDGRKFCSPTTRRMSGAWPPPAPSVWYAHKRASLGRGDRVLDEARFIQRVAVDRDLRVGLLGHTQAAIDGRRRRAPVLVQLQADRTGFNLLAQRFRPARVALAEKAEVHREGLGGLQHQAHVFRARACRSSRRCRWQDRYRRRASSSRRSSAPLRSAAGR